MIITTSTLSVPNFRRQLSSASSFFFFFFILINYRLERHLYVKLKTEYQKCLYKADPTKIQLLYSINWGLQRYTLLFLFYIDYGYSLESHRRSNPYEKYQNFYLIFFFFIFLVVKFVLYLNRLIFIMFTGGI